MTNMRLPINEIIENNTLLSLSPYSKFNKETLKSKLNLRKIVIICKMNVSNSFFKI